MSDDSLDPAPVPAAGDGGGGDDPPIAPTVGGIAFFRDAVVVLGILGFVGVYVYFAWKILQADTGQQPDLDNQLTYLVSAIGGVLASYFAIVLGITQGDESQGVVGRIRQGLRTPLLSAPGTPKPVTLLGTLAFWAYVVVGTGTLVLAFWKSTETPDVIKGTASVFAGYVAAVFGAQFAHRTGVNTGSGSETA
jgi:hypothetical protein